MEDQNNNESQQENQVEENSKEQVEEVEEVKASLEDRLKSCLQMLRKFPVNKYKKIIDAITTLIYEDDELLNNFLQKIDQPSEISGEDKLGEFLKCEYNREGDSYRSNLSNKYYPAPEEGDEEELRFPSENIREMETAFNRLFKEYTRLYFGYGGLCSSYVWQLSDNIEEGICVAVVIKNLVDSQKGIKGGFWDSSHLIVINFDKNEDNELYAKYKLTTTVFFSASLSNKVGEVDFSGSITKLVKILYFINFIKYFIYIIMMI